jgi:asparagine synthase (glutamine-hydrolysing)
VSGLAVTFDGSGRPLAPGLIQKVLEAIRERGIDGSNYFAAANVGLGSACFKTTSDETDLSLPYWNSHRSIAVVLDGRIDNRTELRRKLTGGCVLRNDSDRELVLRAYERWKADVGRHLIGDFVFAIWDADARHIMCVRDPLGVKPFYYAFLNKLFVGGSTLKQALMHPAVHVVPDEGMAAEFLCNGSLVNTRGTFVQQINRLPPGHVLVTSAAGLTVQRYYDWPVTTIRLRSDAEYGRQFRDVFEESVKCRLRNNGSGVACQLSGGLDSSSVASMASTLAQQGAAISGGLEMFSLLAPASAPASDHEEDFIEAVVTQTRVPITRVRPKEFTRHLLLEQARYFRDIPNYPNDCAMLAVNEAVANKRYRVLLTGIGGDEWFYGRPLYYVNNVRGFRAGAIVERFRADRQLHKRNPGASSALQKLMWQGVAPAIPKMLRTVLRQVKGNGRIPKWINPAFAARTCLAERISNAELDDVRVRELPSGRSTFAFEMLDRMNARYHLEMRHPFSDLRVINFARGLPEEQRRRGIWQRYVIRHSLKDLLPAEVASRISKATFDWSFIKALKELDYAAYIRSARIVQLGWIDAEAAVAAYERCLGDASNVITLFVTIALEMWYRLVVLDDGEPAEQECAVV